MIVIVGAVHARGADADARPGGMASEIALTGAAAGSRVEVVARIGDDLAGDAVLLAFVAAGVGHVATLRDPARATPIVPHHEEIIDPHPDSNAMSIDVHNAGPAPTLDAADIALALRYLTDFGVLVVVQPSPDVLAEAVSAASWNGARLVVVVEPETEMPQGVPADALVVAAAANDAEGVGARIGRYAAAISRGDDAAAAYRDLTAAPSV